MKITWFGLSCMYLEGNGARVLMDPFDMGCGAYVPPRLPADLYTISHEHYDHNYREAVSNPKAVRARHGMLESGVRIFGIHTWHDRAQGLEWGPNEVFALDIDGLRMVHLGDLGHELDRVQLAALGRVDVLFIPVGGVYTIGAVSAAKVTNDVNARLTIPMHYYTPHLDSAPFTLAAGVDAFIQHCGREAVRLDRNWLSMEQDAFPDGGIAVFHLK